jgi:hypothetical protein
MIVLGIGHASHVLNTGALAEQGVEYLGRHPFRTLGAAVSFLLLSFLFAYLAARVVHHKKAAALEPGATGWTGALWASRPDNNHAVMATVELKDGRRLAGLVKAFTIEADDNRELTLAGEIYASPLAGQPLKRTKDTFVVLREDQITLVAGQYVDMGRPMT